MGHANHVEMLTCVVTRPEPHVHPETGRLSTALYVQVGTRHQTIRAEVGPVGTEDAAARAALHLDPGTYLHLRGRLVTRPFTHELFEPERVRYCPYCGEPYGSLERTIQRSREVVTCGACHQPLTVARRRVHTLVAVTDMAVLPGGPTQRLPRGRACTSTVGLLGVVSGRVMMALHANTGLVESRFQMAIHRPGGPERGVDYPWVYVLPIDGRDGLAKSVRALDVGDPVYVHGELRARHIRDRNLLPDIQPSYCPGCRGDLSRAPRRHDDRADWIRCPRCQLEVPVSYRSRVVEVVATSVEFLKHVQEFTYYPQPVAGDLL